MRPSEGGQPTRPLLKLNNETDQRYVRRALRYLRATVRAGEIARKVLEDIERDGHSARRFAIFWPNRFGYWQGNKLADAFTGTLEPAPKARRCDVPRWHKVEIRMEDPEGAKKPVVLCSVARLDPESRKWGRHEFQLGTCNLNSNPEKASFSFNWEPLESQYSCGVTHTSKSSSRYRTHPTSEPLPEKAVRQLCLAISSVMTGSPHSEKTSPRTVALHRALPGWLAEDGVPERVWAEIRVLMENHRLAKTVLST